MARKKRKPVYKRIPSLPGEEWKLINGTEDYYISNLGRYKRITPKGESLRKQSIDKDGYCRLNIGHNKYRTHRVVAEAFIPNPDNLPVVDHLDNNKKNNVWTNLEWVTIQENTRRAGEDGLLSRSGQQMVLAIDPEGKGYLYKNIASCARDLNLPTRNTNKVASGKQVTVRGYRMQKLKDFVDRRNWEDGQ